MIAYRTNYASAPTHPRPAPQPQPFRHRAKGNQRPSHTGAFDPILIAVERALDRHGYPPSLFGREAANDPCLVFDLRVGRELKEATRRKVQAFIRELGESL